MVRRSGARQLAAVLFTDIVESTAVASRLGDARWKELIARHHALVRRMLKRYGGTELDTAGDGFFTSFRQPADAIRCACATSDAVRELGIEIRAGVHFGECEQVGRKLGGLTVVVGARVMSLAGPGEVLVTASTAELVAGSGLKFDDRGSHQLKGVDGAWHVVVVSLVDGVPRERPADPADSEARLAAIQPTRHRSRAARATVAAAVAAVLVVGGLVLTLRGNDADTASIDLPADAAARLDLSTGAMGQATLLGDRPGASTLGFGSLWVLLPDRGRVVRLDLGDGDITDTIDVGTASSGIAATDTAIWVSNASEGTVARIDPDANEVSRTLKAGTSPTTVAAQGDVLWVADSIGSRLLRIDTETGASTSVGLPGQPSAVLVTPESVWVTVEPSAVVRVDPDTTDVVFSQEVGNGPVSVVAAFGSIWIANHYDGTVSRLDPVTGAERAKIPVGDGPVSLVAVGDRVWGASELEDAIFAIDPESNAVARTIPVGGSAASLTADGGALWIAAGASSTEHRGGTLRVSSAFPVESMDPGVVYQVQAAQIHSVTNDGLVALRKVGGAGSTVLVADLALALPRASADGLTYRFEMREGVRYSTGETVEPVDFRHSIERSVVLTEGAATLYRAIKGVPACRRDPDTCDLSRSIRVDGASITVELDRPDPNLIHKFAMPFASVIPASTPWKELNGADVPATGPYEITSFDDTGIELVRNPEYTQWSAAAQPEGYVDAISVSFGVKSARAYERLLDGDLDLVLDGLAPRHRSAYLEDHPDRVVSVTSLNLASIGLDTRLPPFDDRRVRRAVSLAFDRKHVLEGLGGPTSARLACRVLPPGLSADTTPCPFVADPEELTPTARDLARARSLVAAAGAQGARVTVWAPSASMDRGWRHILLDLARALRRVGLAALTVTAKDFDEYFDVLYEPKPGSRVRPHAFIYGWTADVPRASDFLQGQFRCRAYGNTMGYCDDDLEARMDAAEALELSNPAEAARAWDEIDRTLRRAAVVLPLGNGISVYPVSARAGNVQLSPILGVFLSRIWVR